MDANRERIERARIKNLEYIRAQDEQRARREADELLASMAATAGVRVQSEGGNAGKKPLVSATATPKNTSVYVTGLTTYMACKQLEGMSAKIGKVKRIKFYKDERGGLKGDAVVTFGSHAAAERAIERLNHLEIKPGVIISAAAADFGKQTTPKPQSAPENSMAPVAAEAPVTTISNDLPARLFTTSAAIDDTTKGATGDTAELVDTAEIAKEERLDLPSRSIILQNIWDPLEPQDNTAAFVAELEDDMRSECSKHGPVEHVHIVANGSVVVRFQALASAIKCLQVMHGRWFAGRQIQASFDPSTPEEPEDEDTKLEAFLASIG